MDALIGPDRSRRPVIVEDVALMSRDCVKILDDRGCIVSVNEDGLRLLELSRRDEIEGRYWPELWPQDLHDLLERALDGARQVGVATFTAACPTAKGAKKWWDVTVVAVPSSAGRFCVVSRDVTAREQRDERRAMDEEMARMALHGSGMVGLWDWIVESDLLHGDSNFARLYGLDVGRTAAGLTEAEYQEFVVAEDLAGLRASIRSVFERGEDFLVEYRLAVPGQPLRWVECKGKMILGGDGTPYRFSGTAIDITPRKQAEEQRHLLMQELSHRVKNTFTLVQAIAKQSLASADAASVQKFESRLLALATAHDTLLQSSWSPSDLRAVATQVLGLEAEGDRYAMSGDAVPVGPQAALSLTLLLHELATNATKYGALSTPGGMVTLSWTVDGDDLTLNWIESGGPPARTPQRRGFGSRLIGMGLAGSRQAELRFEASGLQATFKASLKALAE